jgi:serine/threonine-protein kinase RsbW
VNTRESGEDRTTCRISGAHAVTQASDAARAFAEAQWLGEDEVARLCIIIEELVTNLYDHGGVSSDEEIILTLGSEAKGLTIAIVDPGTPFDPREPRRKTDPSERGAGAGIDIIRSWALITGYEVTEEGNRLELFLPLAS